MSECASIWDERQRKAIVSAELFKIFNSRDIIVEVYPEYVPYPGGILNVIMQQHGFSPSSFVLHGRPLCGWNKPKSTQIVLKSHWTIAKNCIEDLGWRAN